MALHLYAINFATLTPDEKRKLFDNINKFSFNGLHLNPDLINGEFSMQEPYNLNLLCIPKSCTVNRLC